MTIQVSSIEELYSALANAQGGETIELAAGNYGQVDLTGRSGFNIEFASTVTIKSADADHPAVITGLDVRGATNLTFDGLVFDYTFQTGDKIYDRPFSVTGGRNIAITNSTFDGDNASGVSEVSDGYGYAIGLSFRGTENVVVDGNTFFDFHRGMVVTRVDDITVSNNEMYDIRMDGMNFADVENVVIADNYLHDWRGSETSSDHCDMIQFWTNNTSDPSRNILITGNRLDIGDGTPTQSIFMRNDQVDRGLAGEEMYYENVTISNNLIVNGHLHGIVVGETNGLTITNNTVLHDDGVNDDGADPTVEIPRISVASASMDVVIAQNVAYDVNGFAGQSDWVVEHNVNVQDQDANQDGFYNDMFISSTLSSDSGLATYIPIEGSLIDAWDAGIQIVAAEDLVGDAGTVNVFFSLHQDERQLQSYTFDASACADILGAGADFTWVFSDGSTSTGEVVQHTFTQFGAQNATLYVEMPSGNIVEQSVTFDVNSSSILNFGDDGLFYANVGGSNSAVSDTPWADGIDLSARGLVESVDRSYFEGVTHVRDFSISMELTADVAGTYGEVFRLQGSIVVQTLSNGEFRFVITDENGATTRVTSVGANLNDMQTHAVDIQMNDGNFSVFVDDEQVIEFNDVGGLNSSGRLDLTFGNQWDGRNFDGHITEFNVNVGAPMDDLFVGQVSGSLTAHWSEDLDQSALNATSGVDAFYFAA